MYLLRLALRPWRVSFWSQAFSAAAVGVLLLLSGLLAWMHQSLGPVVARMKSEQVLTAYLDPALEQSEPGSEKRVVDQIRTVVGSAPERGSRSLAPEVEAGDPKQFVQRLKTSYPEVSRELEDLGPETQSMIPRFVTVSGILPEGTLEKIQALHGVESAETSLDRLKPTVQAFTALRRLSMFLAGGLAFALLTGLIQLARMNAQLTAESIGVLRLWGASSGQLRVPGLLAGLSVGLLGGVMAGISWGFVGSALTSQIRAASPALRALPSAGMLGAVVLVFAGAALGALSGLLAGGARSEARS